MKIETKFSIGDVVYAIHREYITDSLGVIGPLTIDQVRVVITGSVATGEEYMCVETGIGIGNIYHVDTLFSCKYAAASFVNSVNES